MILIFVKDNLRNKILFFIQSVTMSAYTNLSVVMFCILGWILSLHLEEIQKQVDSVLLPINYAIINDLLRKWSTYHLSIYSAFCSFKRYFSAILSILVVTNFAVMISNLYFMYTNLNYFPPMVVFLIQTLLVFYAICSTADLLKNKVFLIICIQLQLKCS